MSVQPTEKQEVEVGFAQLEITPQVGTVLSGFIFRENKPSTGIDDPLYLRVMAIRFQEQISLLVSYELLGIGEDLYHLIMKELEQGLGVLFHPDRCVLTSVHSHSGPPTVHLEGEAEPDQAYWQLLVNRTLSAARCAITCLRPARLFVASIRIPDLTYNRRAILANGRVTMAIQPDAPVIARGPVDDLATFLVFQDLNGQNLGGIIHFASHGVAVCSQSIGSDIPGQIADYFSKRIDAPCLYLQGATGDLNPTIVSSRREEMVSWVDAWISKAEDLFNLLQPCSVDHVSVRSTTLSLPYAPLPEREDVLLRIARLDQIAQGDVTSPEVVGAISLLSGIMNISPGVIPEEAKAAYCARALAVAERRTLAAIDRRQPLAPCRLCLSVWRLGAIALVFVAAELFAATGCKLRALQPGLMILPVSYNSPLVGYLPDLHSIDKGGYEVDNGWQFYGHPAPFIPQAETNVIQAASELIFSLEYGGT